MNRNTAVQTWRDVCGSDTVMAIGIVTGRMLEEFATRIEAEERERCVKAVEALRDSHCAGTGFECKDDDENCDFVAAWNDAVRAIRGAS